MAWIDADTLIVGTDFGPGSMTDRATTRAEALARGTPLAGATTIFEGRAEDTWVGVSATTARPVSSAP